MGNPRNSTSDGPAARSGPSSALVFPFHTPVKSIWANAGALPNITAASRNGTAIPTRPRLCIDMLLSAPRVPGQRSRIVLKFEHACRSLVLVRRAAPNQNLSRRWSHDGPGARSAPESHGLCDDSRWMIRRVVLVPLLAAGLLAASVANGRAQAAHAPWIGTWE